VLCWRAVLRARENRPVDWRTPHRVSLCPLIAPGTDAETIRRLLADSAKSLDQWSSAQAVYWLGGARRPFEFVVEPAATVDRTPPELPDASAPFLDRLAKTRRFLRWLDEQSPKFPARADDDSRIWICAYPGAAQGAFDDRLSVGTRRGRVGVVFASDDPKEWGNVLCVVMHETLHTVGAPDHRQGDGRIQDPDGLADPTAVPKYPQKQAEIMALGVAQSPDDELRVESLDEVVMGLWTARAIGWR
jgi:hypothetical protein